MGIFGKKKGWDCRANADGTVACRRFEAHKDGKVATGTDVTVGADPKNGCEPYFTGDSNSILDDDEKDLEKVAKRVKSACLARMGQV